jgi:hypothetical protein
MAEKFFTPKEANQMLPEVKDIVNEILSGAQELRALMAAGDVARHEAQMLSVDKRMRAFMAQLETMGCYYKDWNFEIGLVDFPAIIHGQEALLCWRSDEPQVAWFHGYDDGYAGRRPITPQLLFS